MFQGFYDFLARVGYTHPIHAPITHMPIGLVIGALIFFLALLILRQQNFQHTANQSVALALIFAIPTILFGIMDWQHRYGGVMLHEIKIKIILASALVVLLSLALVLNRYTKRDPRVMLPIYLVCAGLVIGLGYFGGQLVFGGEATPRTTTVPTAGPANQSLQRGQGLFAQNCSGCHSNGGNSVVPDLPVIGAPSLADYSGFVAFLREPRIVTGGQTYDMMPPFPKDQISDQQARDLYDYVVQVLSKR
jgi:mono/diheme cytochrome c family protein